MNKALLVTVAGIFVAFPSFAQLPAEIVTEEVIVTATRFLETYLDKPVNVTVISREEIARSGARSVPDLLAREPGFIVRDLFGNNAASTTVDLRGFGATAEQNTLILVDGRRVNDIDLSGVQWSSIPLSTIERIEVVRGGGSVLYGDGAVAGVVNIITKTPEATHATLGATGGSLHTLEARLNGSYQQGDGGLSVAAHRLLSDGYRQNNDNAVSDVHADTLWRGETAQLEFKTGADRQKLRLPGARQVQPSAGINELETDRRGTSTPVDFSTRDGEYATFGVSMASDQADITSEVGYRDKRQTSYFDFGGFPDYREADLSVWSLTPRSRIPFDLLGRAGQIVIGVDLYDWDYSLSRSNSPQNISQPFSVVRAKQENVAAYVLATSRVLSATTISVGWRNERMKIDASEAFDPTAPGAFGAGAPAGSQQEHEHAYELGLRQEFGSQMAVTGKSGRSFRFATVDEIYESSASFAQQFQFLRPQIAHSLETALEQRRSGGSWRVTVFQMDVTDEIHLDPFSVGVGNTNLPPSRRRGVEFEASWHAGPGFVLGGVYSYTQARFREGAFDNNNVVIAGKTVPLVPRHRARLSAEIDLAARTQVVVSALYVGEQFMDNDEANDFGVTIPAYHIVDARLTHRTGNWRIGMTLNNLFAQKYYNYAVRSQFVADRYNAYPLPERTVFLSVEYHLGR